MVSPRLVHRLARGTVGGVLVLALGGACGTPNVGLSLTLAKSVASQATWYEVGAYRGASCTTITKLLGNGVPEGWTARLAFQPDDATPPSFGKIPNASYAFAAVARNAKCGVIAEGCKVLDVGNTSQVIVPLDATDAPTGECAAGTTCQAGSCVPANDNRDPSVGADCSLELLGAGPLATPLSASGTLVSAPAIGLTSTGFVIAYREAESNGASARVTVLPIDSSGGALTPIRPMLPSPCADSDETDGVGLVVNNDQPILALAKAPCGDSPQLQLLDFRVSPPKFIVSTKDGAPRVTLGASRAAATRPDGSVVVYTSGGVGNIAVMDPDKGIVVPNGTFGGDSVTSSWVAANDRVLALLALGAGTPTATDGDAGVDAGVVNDPTANATSTLRLLMLPSNTAIDSIVSTTSTPITFPGVWGSIAASGSRVIVVSDSTGGRSATYRAFDQGNDKPTDVNGFTVEGDGDVSTGDVAIANNRAYFATLKPGGVSLNVYAAATTVLTPLRNTLFARETRISAINLVRDGQIAVAASDSRVAVVWTTSKKLIANDVTGGYAVFACTQ